MQEDCMMLQLNPKHRLQFLSKKTGMCRNIIEKNMCMLTNNN